MNAMIVLEILEMLIMSTKIIATGSYVPDNIVTNFDYEKILDTSDDWISQRTGIEQRRFESVSTVHMATEAAKKALAGIDYNSIDCIIVGTYTPDNLIPGVAAGVRASLNINHIPVFDINAACSGFMFALQTGHAYIKSHLYKRILVIGADFNSRILNYRDRSTAILFGDGAGAVVIEEGESGIIDTILGGEIDSESTLGLLSGNDFGNPFYTRSLNTDGYFTMKGSEVFRFATRIIKTSVKELLKRNNLNINEIDYIIAHQANQRILDMAGKSLKLDEDIMLSNVKMYGNTSSGSVPLLLDEANRRGLLEPGMKVILIAFGGGLSYGASLLEW